MQVLNGLASNRNVYWTKSAADPDRVLVSTGKTCGHELDLTFVVGRYLAVPRTWKMWVKAATLEPLDCQSFVTVFSGRPPMDLEVPRSQYRYRTGVAKYYQEQVA